MRWPVVTTETLDWRDSWRTYEAAIVPAIADLDVAELLDAETAARVGAAQQAISAFDAGSTRPCSGRILVTGSRRTTG